jgi:hypothetical protein
VSGECCKCRGGHKRARAARSQGEERRPWFGTSEFLCVAAGAHKQKALCMCRALSEGGAGSLPQSTLARWQRSRNVQKYLLGFWELVIGWLP